MRRYLCSSCEVVLFACQKVDIAIVKLANPMTTPFKKSEEIFCILGMMKCDACAKYPIGKKMIMIWMCMYLIINFIKINSYVLSAVRKIRETH